MSKILAIGNVYLDINCSNVPFDEKGIIPEKEPVSDTYIMEPGGSALNFAHQCAKLQLDAAFVGKAGIDRAGQLVSELIEDWGLHVALVRSPTVSTNLAINFTNPVGQTISTASGSANQSLEQAEVSEQLTRHLPELKYIYIGGCFKLYSLLPALEQIIITAQAAGVKIVFDHNRIPTNASLEQQTIVKKIALLSDYYFPSRAEFLELWSLQSIEQGLEQLKGQSNVQIIVKNGEDGCLALDEQNLIKMPAFPIQLVNTIGAGDSFNAGFIAGQEQGLNLAKSMEFANATAALKISQATLPILEDVHTLVASH